MVLVVIVVRSVPVAKAVNRAGLAAMKVMTALPVFLLVGVMVVSVVQVGTVMTRTWSVVTAARVVMPERPVTAVPAVPADVAARATTATTVEAQALQVPAAPSVV